MWQKRKSGLTENKIAIAIVLLSAIFASTYYFTKSAAYEQYRIPALSPGHERVLAYKININLASAKEFENLPGIGPKLAAKIVANRETYGRFDSISQIQRVPGIGTKKYKAIENYLTVKI